MAFESPSLFALARDKLHSIVATTKDTAHLHRWVLLKNSIISSHPFPSASAEAKAEPEPVYSPQVAADPHDEFDQDSFEFPDPDSLNENNLDHDDHREGEWLDSLLSSLGGDDEDEDVDADADDRLSASHAHNAEDDEPLSPFYSPMSSSDDLVEHVHYYYQQDIVTPYPVPYPPLPPLAHPPLIPDWFEVDSSSLDTPTPPPSPPLYHDPLPYFDADELEDLPVPDAIEDTSDDESDALLTPSSNSTSSLACAVVPPSPSPQQLQHQQQRTRSVSPQVYIDSDDSHFYPFELDPLPFPHVEERHQFQGAHAYRCPPIYPEC